MRLIVGLIVLGSVMGCGKTYDVSVATDPRILRGAWQGRLDAICQAKGGEYALNPDGSKLVETLEPSVWDVTTKQRIAQLEESQDAFISDMRWTPDGNLIGVVRGKAAATRLQRWNGATGAAVGAPRFLELGTHRLSHDGQRVATVLFSSTAPVETGLTITNLESDASTAIALEPYAVEFRTSFLGFTSDDARLVRVSERRASLETTDQAVQVWRASDGALIHSSLQNFDYRGLPRAFTLDQTSLWALSGTTLRRFELVNGSVSQTENFTAFNSALRLEISPDGSSLGLVSPEAIDLYSTTNLSQKTRRVPTESYLAQNALSWTRDSSRVIFPTQKTLKPVRFYFGIGVQCGFASERVGGQDRIDFEQQGAEGLDAQVNFTATFQNQSEYSVGGTISVSGQSLEVSGAVRAGTNERLHLQIPAMVPPMAKLEFKGLAGASLWKSGANPDYTILLTEPQSPFAPYAQGVMVRASDQKEFLLQLQRAP